MLRDLVNGYAQSKTCFRKHKCAFCDEAQIAGCLATSGDKVKPSMASEDGSCDSGDEQESLVLQVSLRY